MSMSMSVSGGSSTCGPLNPKTWVDSSFQEEDLCLYFGKFRVNTDNSKQTETNTSSPGSSSNVSPTKPQQSEACSYPKYEIGVENSHSVPIPLYSQDIWRGQSVNTGGKFFIFTIQALSCVGLCLLCCAYTYYVYDCLSLF